MLDFSPLDVHAVTIEDGSDAKLPRFVAVTRSEEENFLSLNVGADRVENSNSVALF